MGIKIRKSDKLFSTFIRQRANWKCERCGRQHEMTSQGLHCAHVFTRSREATRHDPENAYALCYGCHSWGHRNPLQFHEWVKGKMGDEAYMRLMIRSNSYGKRDDKLAEITLQAMLKELEK